MPTDDKIPDDLSSLLRDARSELPSAGAKDRVWAKTMAQVDGPAPVPPSTAAASGAASAVRTAAIVGFAAGVLAGVAGTYAAISMFVATPKVASSSTATPVAASSATPAPTATPRIAITVQTPVAKKTAVALLATPEPGVTSAERATERAWLDAARTALGRGDLDAAMQSLETARTRFPEGSLREEREAISVHVLIARGNLEDARLAVKTFRKRHEGSLFLPAIEDAMREMESRQ